MKGMESKDSESIEASTVEVRLYVNDSSIGMKDDLARESALIKHFSPYGKVSDILPSGPELSVLHLRGEAEVVEKKEKLNNGGCECDVEGGCKIVVDVVDPDFNNPVIMSGRGFHIPDFAMERSRRYLENLERKKIKRKAKKPERMNSNYISDAYVDPTLNGRVSILVSGYDTSLPEDDIYTLMHTHFSSCGEITGVNFTNRLGYKGIVVDIEGDKAKENALLLNQSVLGGRKLVVKVVPPGAFNLVFKSSSGVIRRMREQNERLRQMPPPPDYVVVTGYDTRLPVDDIKSALRKHFSSCGEIICLAIYKARNGGFENKASIYFGEKGAADKAWKLSGSDMGGWKVDVVHRSSPMHQTL